MTKNKICEWKGCDLVAKQKEIESFILRSVDSGLKLLRYKYPDHNKVEENLKVTYQKMKMVKLKKMEHMNTNIWTGTNI